MYKSARFYKLNKGFQRLFTLIGFLLLLASGSITILFIHQLIFVLGGGGLPPLEVLFWLILPAATWFVYWFLIRIYLWLYDGFVGND